MDQRLESRLAGAYIQAAHYLTLVIVQWFVAGDEPLVDHISPAQVIAALIQYHVIRVLGDPGANGPITWPSSPWTG